MGPSARKLLRSALLAAAALAAVPAAGQADVSVFGSDLTAPANTIEAHGADSAFWNVNLANGNATAAPADGQITEVKVKGTVIDNPDSSAAKPVTMIHFQVLHPQPDGSVKVELSSGDFYTPLGGDPQQISTYHPINLCVHKGDIVDFNDIGGSEWWWWPYTGMPYQVFSSVQGSSTAFYTADNGTNVGTQWKPREVKQNQELLMQTKLATGPHATDICPGGFAQHQFRGLEVTSPQTALLKTKSNLANVRAFCHGENYGSCKGRLTLHANVGEDRVELGSVPFSIKHAYTDYLQVPISAVNTRLIQAVGQVKVTATAEAQDDPRSDARADASVPVQRRTTQASFTLKADRSIKDCIVPRIKRKTTKDARKILMKANCALGAVKRKKNSLRYLGRVVSHKPPVGTVLPERTRIAVTVGMRK